MIGQCDLTLGVIQWILGKVITSGQRIGAGGVFVGTESQLRLSHAGQNLRKFLFVERVTVFDRPHVVRTNADHGIVALDVAARFKIEIDRVVIHNGSTERLFAFDFFAVHFSQSVDRRRFKVVSQSERVPDFVTNQISQ